MYAYLIGKFIYKSPAQVYLEANGVGYEVNISLNTYESIQGLEEGRLFTYLQVKEDAHTIFGFFEKEEKDIFMLLLSVSGVGATTARMMLSSIRPDEIARAIQQSNVKLLESVKGIGRKSAERIVLELKDKVSKGLNQSAGMMQKEGGIINDAVVALTSLGIARIQAEKAVQTINNAEPGILELEVLIKKALKAI
jgi:Holliday junction DNA helicase RuvA